MKRQTQSRFHLRSNSPSCKTSLLHESKIKSLPFEPLIKTDGFPCVTVAVRIRRSSGSSEVQSLNTEYMHNKRRLMSVGPNFRSIIRVQIGRLFWVPVGIKSHFPICVCASHLPGHQHSYQQLISALHNPHRQIVAPIMLYFILYVFPPIS